MAFCISPAPVGKRQRKPSLNRRPKCVPATTLLCCTATRISRTRVSDVDAKSLAALAFSAEHESGIAGRVVALHRTNRGEILRVGAEDGALALCWPSRPEIATPASSSTQTPDDGRANARAILASAESHSTEQAQILQARAGALLRHGVAQGDILGGLVLAEGNPAAPSRVLILLVSHPDGDTGATFDPEFAGADWAVERYAAVHPPLSAWTAQMDDGQQLSSDTLHTVNVATRAAIPSSAPPTGESPPSSTVALPGEPGTPPPPPGNGGLAKASDAAPKARLLLGSGALDGVAIKMRDVARIPDDKPLTAFTVSGWNEARVQPFTVECQAPSEAGRLRMRVGANVHAADLTVAGLRRAVASLREVPAEVVAAFGGGAVMDGGKAVAALGGQTDVAVEEALETVQAAALRGEREATVRLPAAPLPAVLIPGLPGAGAELSERVLIAARVPSGVPGEATRRHSVFVTFDYPPGVVRHSGERTCIVDPRLHAPRRVNGRDAAQGALLIVATALDALLCAAASPQTRELARDALLHAADSVVAAHREPTSSDGPARDDLARASAAAALARDSLSVGLGSLLTVAVVDSFRDVADDGEFRQVAVRVMASLVREAGRFEALERIVSGAACICCGDEDAGPEMLAMWLIRRAEDAGVPQLYRIGARKKRVEENIRRLVSEGCVRNAPHPAFEDVDVLLRVVDDAMNNQPFEL